ncbi:MAG: PIN domain-containing protein [bacterium]|nr:PIN domain-containing protein [bacterium]
MTAPRLSDAIAASARILLDTSTLIAYFDNHERVSPFATQLVDEFVFAGRNHAVISTLTVAEVLVRPRRVNLEGYQHAGDFFHRFPNLRMAPVDFAVAQQAAALRTLFSLKTPDALVIATGIAHQVSYLVTNDREWARKLQPLDGRIAVCLLSDFL